MQVGGANRGMLRSGESRSRWPRRWEEAGVVVPPVRAAAAARLGVSRGRSAARLGASRAAGGRKAGAGQGTPPFFWEEDRSGSSADCVLFGRIRLGSDDGDPPGLEGGVRVKEKLNASLFLQNASSDTLLGSEGVHDLPPNICHLMPKGLLWMRA
jgi:hypothetical protein